METFAYLQVAEDYENPESKELVFLKDGLAALNSLSGMKLPSQTLFVLLGVASSAFILNIASAAQAALYRGDSGSDVTYLQNLLNDNGYSVPVTGYYGSQTESQVYSFQYDRYLTSDGVAGSATMSALEGFLGVAPDPGSSGALRFGSSGSAVTDLQYALSSAGYFSGPYTGYFGSTTEQAVISFQYDNYLTADGIAGSATLAALGTGGFQPILPGGGSTYRFGDSGAGVSNIQSLLGSLGYAVPVTGYFGTQTEQAVINFQSYSGLVADGIVGSNTLAAMEGSSFQPIRPGVGSTYRFGDSGAGVSSIQDLLNANGYSVSITGYFGSVTEQQVISFQANNGISADGIVGPQTYAALLSR
ncbi:MAG: peptidoglycan-binding protein [Drouetiella hepatica Uher 2000/2452]|jgi:peptidoglycan hydrolase-like protein with peptidoglycan-binding domain|uniref:Peptidoglycan-binding protein n=1 Tax=Drouetiella hepatica Uher 2000/2452 TaxID=904376 RepID=A0A951QCF7_9CYAN|nr:peptidoglycan-binding protein [Drouetiella hepatica Uher 2000/2452]